MLEAFVLIEHSFKKVYQIRSNIEMQSNIP